MNYDLAMMALEGLTRSRLSVRYEKGEAIIEGDTAAFKDFARLCLLLGGGSETEGFELQPGVHTDGAPLRLKMR